MHPEVILADGAYNRAKCYQEVAHRRLVASAPTVLRTGARDRLGRALILVGTRLKGMASPIAKPTPLVDPVMIAPTSQ